MRLFKREQIRERGLVTFSLIEGIEVNWERIESLLDEAPVRRTHQGAEHKMLHLFNILESDKKTTFMQLLPKSGPDVIVLGTKDFMRKLKNKAQDKGLYIDSRYYTETAEREGPEDVYISKEISLP